MSFHLTRLFSTDIGIDLGTANCLVYVRDLDRLVLNEPSVVVRQVNTHEVRHVGAKAKELLGYEPMHNIVEGLEVAMPWYTQFLR